MTSTPALIVHGGAGTVPEEEIQQHIDGVREAARAGWALLTSGGTALDAVETAARLLEDNPSFDAGHGSYLNSSGHIEMDALIMDGATLESGAVAAVQSIANPISLARLVMTETPHSLLVGEGAQQFAERMNIERLPEEELLVRRELKRWQEWKRTQDDSLFTPPDKPGHGTVGAVALDVHGNIASATSTGGTRNKLAGRVGDSPLIGSGGYADNRTGGCSATGLGESLMKLVISKTVCDLIGEGLSAQEAAAEAVGRLGQKPVNGSGGVIVIDRHGQVGFAYNTQHMPYAIHDADGEFVASL